MASGSLLVVRFSAGAKAGMGRLVENGTGIEARRPCLPCDVERSPAQRMTGVHHIATGGKIIAILAGNTPVGHSRTSRGGAKIDAMRSCRNVGRT